MVVFLIPTLPPALAQIPVVGVAQRPATQESTKGTTRQETPTAAGRSNLNTASSQQQQALRAASSLISKTEVFEALTKRVQELEKQVSAQEGDQITAPAAAAGGAEDVLGALQPWLRRWWQWGISWGFLWLIPWFVFSWQWWRRRFWLFAWPWPWWWWIPWFWFIPWLWWGWWWGFCFAFWWCWFWWWIPWIFWIFWWLIVLKHVCQWLAAKKP